jgi:phosphohistidine phosphatase SixA
VKRIVALIAITLVMASSPALASEKAWKKVSSPKATGYVLLLRHAIAPGVGDPANFKIGDCSTQRNLSKEGRAQARAIGAWLKSKKIQIAGVESSRWCRSIETAKLMDIGKVKQNPNLDSLFNSDNPIADPRTAATREQIIKHRNKQGLLVLVFHQINIMALASGGVDSGEGVLVRANRDGELKVMGLSPVP